MIPRSSLFRETSAVSPRSDPDIQRAVRFEQFPLQRDEPAGLAGGRGQAARPTSRDDDDPGVGEQVLGKMVNSRGRADEAVGAADDSGAARQVEAAARGAAAARWMLTVGSRAVGADGQKADAAREAAVVVGEIFQQRPAVVENDELCPAAQRHFEQGRVFQIDFQQIDDVAQHMVPGRAGGLFGQRQDLSDSHAQAVLPAFEFFEQGPAGLQRAALLAQFGQVLLGFGLLLAAIRARRCCKACNWSREAACLRAADSTSSFCAAQVAAADGDFFVEGSASSRGRCSQADDSDCLLRFQAVRRGSRKLDSCRTESSSAARVRVRSSRGDARRARPVRGSVASAPAGRPGGVRIRRRISAGRPRSARVRRRRRSPATASSACCFSSR